MMDWRKGLWAVAAFIPACANLRAVSSGHVGCPAAEVVISNDTSEMGNRTWVAECRGRRYFCSAYDVSSKSSQVTCAPEEGGRESARPGPPAATPVTAAAPDTATAPPPTGAAGFVFGSTVEQAQSACTGAGYEWTAGEPDHFQCSGTAADVGMTSGTLVRFCEQKLCALVLAYEPSAKTSLIDDFTAVRNALGSKYGRAPREETGVPSDCRSPQEFRACLEQERFRLSYEWFWPTGERIKLTLGRSGEDDAAVMIRLQYVRLERVRPRTEGL